MPRIVVEATRPGEFRVRVHDGAGETAHTVTVAADDLGRLTSGQASAEELVRHSFEFLLEHEPKESILARFDLMVIARYFPEYEAENPPAPRGLTMRRLVALLLAVAGLGGNAMALSLTSPSFAPHGEIPKKYTCEGDDVSPPLAWSGVPSGAKSLVLIIDDPDAPDPRAPKTTWVHWVVYGLPATTTGLPEAVKAASLPPGARAGLNDWGRPAYGGPCPPVGRHRYFHKLYALDAVLPDLPSPRKADVERAMEGHVLEHTELIGTYQKSER